MSGPWEQFRQAEKPPWEEFSAAEKPSEAATPAPNSDRYRQAAEEDLRRTEGTGAGRLQRQVMQGLTFGLADEIIAGAMTPLEMIRRRTLSPSEAYNYAKAREDLALERDRQRDGHLGTAAEMAAGIASGVGLARGGVTAARFLRPDAGLAARSAAMAADGMALGGLTGAATGSGEGRVTGALTGAGVGGVVGGLMPTAGTLFGMATAPIRANIAARANPGRHAEGQMARALSASGKTAQDIADEVASAAREGQSAFTVADALGNPGQRLLSTVARNPGPGRTAAVDFLEARQAEQGRRIAGALDDAFGSSRTAQQLRTAEEATRRMEAGRNYGAAREAAGAVDVSRAIAAADDILTPGATRLMSPQSGIADNTVDGIVRRARSLLTDGRSTLSNFSEVLKAKQDIDDLIQGAMRGGSANQARALTGIRNELDAALEAASKPYAAARDAFRASKQVEEAIDTGRQAAQRGRYEDTIPAFQRMNEAQQHGFRAGYVDPLIERAQNAAQGVNKAREFTSDASRAERMAFALPSHGSLLNRQIGRENTMFATRNHALGGSRTADNLADDAAAALPPEIVGNLLTGNWAGAVRNFASRGTAAMGGNTEAVRSELSRLLLQRGDAGPDVARILIEATRTAEGRRELLRILGRGGLAAGAVAPDALNIPATRR